MGRRGTHPWQDIKKDYVNGIKKDGHRIYPSFRELEAKYGTAFNTISIRAKKEDWLSERQIVVNKIEQNRTEKTIEQISNKGVDFDLKSFTISQAEQDTLKELLSDPNIKVSERCMLIKALKDLQVFAKAALGENSSEEQVKIIVERVE